MHTTLRASISCLVRLRLLRPGAEIDPVSLKKHWKASLSLGFVAFILPLIGAFCFARFVFDWNFHGSEIAGIALSTTSVAVVYAVMVETGLNRHDIGKLILAACFVCDLGTVLALGGLFATYGWLLLVFVAVTTLVLSFLPRTLRWVVANVGHRVSEPEVKIIFVVLLGLGGLATAAGSEAVLPAYVAGLVVAGVFMNDRVILDRIRTIAFALLMLFFFLCAGTLHLRLGLHQRVLEFHRDAVPRQDGDEIHWALAHGHGVQVTQAREGKTTSLDGDGLDLRVNISALWVYAPFHQ